MEETYYTCRYRFAGQDGFVLWYTNDHDGVRLDAQGQVVSFQTLPQLHHYAALHQLPLVASDAAAFYDLDAIATWLTSDMSTTFDCETLLTAWNFLSDIATSVGQPFDPDHNRTQVVYDKLFYGNNLPAVTPTGQSYAPAWTPDELALLREIFAEGLQLVEHAVRPVAARTS